MFVIVSGLILLLSMVLLLSGLMLPAILAMRSHINEKRLSIQQNRDDDPRFFSKQFFSHLENDFGREVLQAPGQWRSLNKQVVFKKKYLIIGGKQKPDWREWQNLANSRKLITVIGGSAHLPNQTIWLYDIYAPFTLEIGESSTVRAIRCEGLLNIATNASIIRWVDALRLNIARGCILVGRASARQILNLSADIQFQRLSAPIIQVAYGQNIIDQEKPDTTSADARHQARRDFVVLSPKEVNDGANITGRIVYTHDVYIPPMSHITCDIICHGKIHIGQSCIIVGCIKGRKGIVCEPQVEIIGSLVSDTNIEIDQECTITNVILAAGNVTIGSNCIIGTQDQLSSICAQNISLSCGVRMYGSIIARNEGIIQNFIDADDESLFVEQEQST